MYTDPIADLLVRLQNATTARHEHTSLPSSQLKKEILQVMKDRSLIKDYQETADGTVKKILTVDLFPGKTLTVKRVSKPGQRIYRKAKEIFPVLSGYGISIISTSQGLMTGDAARKKGVGGELLCEVY